MFKHIPLIVNDSLWSHILSDLHADVNNGGIHFITPTKKLSSIELSDYVDSLKRNYLKHIGADILSDSEQKLILILPATALELKSRMGYAESTNTHTIETIVYNIRKKLGQNFIKLENGKYKL